MARFTSKGAGALSHGSDVNTRRTLRWSSKTCAVFGDPKVSPTLAKAMLSSEAHKADAAAGMKLLAAQKASASTASSLLLIAEFTFFLMMLYLLNHRDVNVKRLSWSTLNSSVAIFISMLLFMSTKSFWILLAGRSMAGTPWGVAVTWARYIVVWFLGPMVLLRRGTTDSSREAWCAIVQWFTAFCGADCFGELMMIQVFSASVETQFGGFLLCCFVIWVQCFGACWARHFIVLAAAAETAAEGVSPREVKEKWAEAWQTAETTYAGYVLGLTLSMWTRYGTSGVPTGPYGRLQGQTTGLNRWIIAWTVLAVLVGFIGIGLVHRLGAPERSWTSRRFSQMSTSIMAMFCAWMCLYTMEWEFLFYTSASGFGGQASDINASILLAICASVFMFSIMRIIDFIADKTGSAAVRSTAIFCELFIGLTWQRVFFWAITLSGHQHNQAGRAVDVLCMWSLAAIAGPAWYFYILPSFLKAREEEAAAEGAGDATKEAPAASSAPAAGEKPKDDEEF